MMEFNSCTTFNRRRAGTILHVTYGAIVRLKHRDGSQ
jgi:hypothetical protein